MAGQYAKASAFGGGSSGASAFIDLTDVPSAYTGQGTKLVRVNSGETALEFVAASGGDVSGPASSTDNAVARFDLATGKLLQDSIVTISDTGEIVGGIQLTLRDDASLPGAGDNMVKLENRSDTPASHAHLEFRKARAANADLANNDEVGGINFHARHNSTTASITDIVSIYTGDGTTRTGDLSFLLSSAGAPAERMRLTGAGSLQLSALTASTVPYMDANKGFASSAVTPTELGYVSGVTSAIQTQINAKAPSASPTFTGTVTTPATASRALVTGASSELTASATTATEIGYVSGVTSAIQTQLNAKGVGDMTLSGVQTVTGAKTFGTIGGAVGKLILAGSTSGSSILNAAAVAGSTTLTLPGTTGTLVGSGDTGTVSNTMLGGSIALSKLVALTTSRALQTNASTGAIEVSSVTNTELGYVSGVTSAIQTQLNGLITPTVETKTGDFTAAANKIYLVSSAAARAITLPAAASGARFFIKDSTGSCETNNFTLTRVGSEKIDGIAANRILQANWGSWTLVSDGTDWFVL